MREMKTLTLGITPYKVVDEEARNKESGGGDAAEYNRLNVRDYGAVGDGVTNDQPAIWDAITAAKALIAQDIPCEIYFPAGTYGILEGGFGIALPRGKGGLRITGAGRETTTIKYLADWQNSSRYGGSAWYAIDVHPENSGVIGDYDTYIHDVAITGLTVYDPDPCSHASHPDKGDSDKEENHGVNIGWCLRASVAECQFITVGDEAIDIYSCSDVVVMNNHLVGCPGAGSSGGAISICDGCDGVVVSNNTINGSAEDETLENGTVIQKENFGIAVESLHNPVRNVVIANNVARNIWGNGINIAATNTGSGLCNILIEGNILQGCNEGISDDGGFTAENITVRNNTITDCTKLHGAKGQGISFDTLLMYNTSVCNNTICNTEGCGYYAHGHDTKIDGNVFKNIGSAALFIYGSAVVRNCIFQNTGVVDGTSAAAILCYGDTVYTVSGCRLTGVRQAKGIYNATEIEDTTIEMVDADGNRYTIGKCVDSDRLKRLANCQLDGYISISVDNAIVHGNTINNGEGWAHALEIKANGVIVSGNNITLADKSKSKKAIAEGSGKHHNLFIGNVCNTAITTVGAQSVAVNNIDTSVTA